MRRTSNLSTLLLALALSGCTIPLSSWSNHSSTPPDDGSALDARLARCAALGANASNDSDCQTAWTEARRRIISSASEK